MHEHCTSIHNLEIIHLEHETFTQCALRHADPLYSHEHYTLHYESFEWEGPKIEKTMNGGREHAVSYCRYACQRIAGSSKMNTTRCNVMRLRKRVSLL